MRMVPERTAHPTDCKERIVTFLEGFPHAGQASRSKLRDLAALLPTLTELPTKGHIQQTRHGRLSRGPGMSENFLPIDGSAIRGVGRLRQFPAGTRQKSETPPVNARCQRDKANGRNHRKDCAHKTTGGALQDPQQMPNRSVVAFQIPPSTRHRPPASAPPAAR